MDPVDLALEEAAARRERVESRRADLRATTGRVYGFLGGLLAVGLAVLLSAGDAFTAFFAVALATGALALICILLARARPARPGPVDLTGHGGDGFADAVLGERISAAAAAEKALAHSRPLMLAAELLAAAAALVLAVGAIVVALEVDEHTARVPLGAAVGWDGATGVFVVTPGAEAGERLRALANPPGGVPALVVGAAGRGNGGCLPPYGGGTVLRPGTAIRGDALARALGEREPRAPLTVALCVPGARTVTGLRAVDLTWGSRPLD